MYGRLEMAERVTLSFVTLSTQPVNVVAQGACRVSAASVLPSLDAHRAAHRAKSSSDAKMAGKKRPSVPGGEQLGLPAGSGPSDEGRPSAALSVAESTATANGSRRRRRRGQKQTGEPGSSETA